MLHNRLLEALRYYTTFITYDTETACNGNCLSSTKNENFLPKWKHVEQMYKRIEVNVPMIEMLRKHDQFYIFINKLLIKLI